MLLNNLNNLNESKFSSNTKKIKLKSINPNPISKSNSISISKNDENKEEVNGSKTIGK
jgi:hypothetical protein